MALVPKRDALFLQGDFDGPAFRRIRELLCGATAAAPIVLNFRDVHFCQPFALGALFEMLTRSGGAIQALGLSQQNDVLLGYLGFRAEAPQPQRGAELSIGIDDGKPD
jgi:anti-anti-sigma regulatory factor